MRTLINLIIILIGINLNLKANATALSFYFWLKIIFNQLRIDELETKSLHELLNSYREIRVEEKKTKADIKKYLQRKRLSDKYLDILYRIKLDKEYYSSIESRDNLDQFGNIPSPPSIKDIVGHVESFGDMGLETNFSYRPNSFIDVCNFGDANGQPLQPFHNLKLSLKKDIFSLAKDCKLKTVNAKKLSKMLENFCRDTESRYVKSLLSELKSGKIKDFKKIYQELRYQDSFLNDNYQFKNELKDVKRIEPKSWRKLANIFGLSGKGAKEKTIKVFSRLHRYHFSSENLEQILIEKFDSRLKYLVDSILDENYQAIEFIRESESKDFEAVDDMEAIEKAFYTYGSVSHSFVTKTMYDDAGEFSFLTEKEGNLLIELLKEPTLALNDINAIGTWLGQAKGSIGKWNNEVYSTYVEAKGKNLPAPANEIFERFYYLDGDWKEIFNIFKLFKTDKKSATWLLKQYKKIFRVDEYHNIEKIERIISDIKDINSLRSYYKKINQMYAALKFKEIKPIFLNRAEELKDTEVKEIIKEQKKIIKIFFDENMEDVTTIEIVNDMIVYSTNSRLIGKKYLDSKSYLDSLKPYYVTETII